MLNFFSISFFLLSDLQRVGEDDVGRRLLVEVGDDGDVDPEREDGVHRVEGHHHDYKRRHFGFTSRKYTS